MKESGLLPLPSNAAAFSTVDYSRNYLMSTLSVETNFVGDSKALLAFGAIIEGRRYGYTLELLIAKL
jgi:hypothetical protein